MNHVLLVPVIGKDESPGERRRMSELIGDDDSLEELACEERELLPGQTVEPISADVDGETLCRLRDGSEWWIPTDLIP